MSLYRDVVGSTQNSDPQWLNFIWIHEKLLFKTVYNQKWKNKRCFFWNQTRFVTKNEILNTVSVFLLGFYQKPDSLFLFQKTLLFRVYYLVFSHKLIQWKEQNTIILSGLHIIFFINWSLLEWKSKFWFKCQNNFFQASNFHYKTAKSK